MNRTWLIKGSSLLKRTFDFFVPCESILQSTVNPEVEQSKVFSSKIVLLLLESRELERNFLKEKLVSGSGGGGG